MGRLEIEGYNILNAENAQVALKTLLNLSPDSLPDCIILDHFMPVMDGKAFLQELQLEHPKTLGRIPVIVCSAFGDFERTRQVFQIHTKPLKLEDLGNTIKRIFTRNNQPEAR
jgi:CheY-like chemotaxis protein